MEDSDANCSLDRQGRVADTGSRVADTGIDAVGNVVLEQSLFFRPGLELDSDFEHASVWF